MVAAAAAEDETVVVGGVGVDSDALDGVDAGTAALGNDTEAGTDDDPPPPPPPPPDDADWANDTPLITGGGSGMAGGVAKVVFDCVREVASGERITVDAGICVAGLINCEVFPAPPPPPLTTTGSAVAAMFAFIMLRVLGPKYPAAGLIILVF